MLQIRSAEDSVLRVAFQMKSDELRPGNDVAQMRGFDDYAFRLGDEMRGRRASMGKSLLDVERALRIRAVLVDAIEKADPESFEASWLIPGHVRSYARYLEMDPDDAYRRFCAECGYNSSEDGSLRSKERGRRPGLLSFFRRRRNRRNWNQIFGDRQSNLRQNRLAVDALGSSLVLMALAVGILYVGWAVYDEIQGVVSPDSEQVIVVANAELTSDSPDSLPGDEIPELGPQFPRIATRGSGSIGNIDPDATGFFASNRLTINSAGESSGSAKAISAEPIRQAFEDEEIATKDVIIVPSRPSWIRVTDASGTTLFEKVLASGEQYTVPDVDDMTTLRAGNSGSLYFLIDGKLFGPAGTGQKVVKNVNLSAGAIQQSYGRVFMDAVPEAIHDLIRYSEASGGSE